MSKKEYYQEKYPTEKQLAIILWAGIMLFVILILFLLIIVIFQFNIIQQLR